MPCSSPATRTVRNAADSEAAPGAGAALTTSGNPVREGGRHRMNVRIKRVYLPAEPDDGVRILVDHLWPRGVAKLSARIDLWLKDIAPSTELRQWFNHDPTR